MSKLFQYNRKKRLKLGGLNSPIQKKFNYMLFPSKSKNKKAKQNKTKQKKNKRTVIDILCKGKQKRVYITKIGYKVLDFEANKSS